MSAHMATVTNFPILKPRRHWTTRPYLVAFWLVIAAWIIAWPILFWSVLFN